MLVLGIMFSVPLFTISTYRDESIQYDYGLEYIEMFDDQIFDPLFNETLESFIEIHSSLRTPLIYLEIPDNFIWQSNSTKLEELRDIENEIVGSDDPHYSYIAVYDLRKNTKLGAGLSICRTFFICFILSLGAVYFQKDASELVIKPIESMIYKVTRIARNPLEAA